MEASQFGKYQQQQQIQFYSKNRFSEIKFSFLFHFQNQTPIYNLAAGTCLYVKEPKAGAIVQLGLCSTDANSSWDLVKKIL